MILAVSGQQNIALAVIALLVVGWAAYFIFIGAKGDQPAGAEIETAPNRQPYLTDDELEGPKLDRALLWGLIVLAFTAVALPVYWLSEPGRQDNAIKGFSEASVKRGAELFQSSSVHLPPGHISAGCANCHSDKGQGGTVEFTLTDPKDPSKIIPVTWEAPALDTVMYRFSPDEVRTILIYGRPPTPMPPWGVLGGGALGDQQIADLVNFLISIQKPEKAVLKDAAQYGLDGKALFEAYCARCHTLGWSYRTSYKESTAIPGGGAYGPNLTNGDTLRQFPNRSTMIDFINSGSDFGKNYGRRGIGNGRMPGFGPDPNKKGATEEAHCEIGNNAHCTSFHVGAMLTPKQIAAIVDYERSL